MELGRLKQFPENYDIELFNSLRADTKKLIKTMVYNIDARKFGVSSEEVESWFENKFLQVFIKYHDKKEPNILKAYMINSLRTFKNKILSRSYLEKYNHLYQETVSMDDYATHHDIPDDEEYDYNQFTLVSQFYKSKLSPEAFQIFLVKYRPPLYIIDKLKCSSDNIPAHLIAEFLGWGDSPGVLKFIRNTLKELDTLIEEAKEYFKA